MAALVRFFVLGCVFSLSGIANCDELQIQPTGPNVLGQRVEVTLEFRGNLSAEFDGDTATDVPLEVDGRFVYRERQMRSQRSTRYLRQYETAGATIDYGRGQQVSTLDKENTWVIADRREDPDQGKRVRFLTSTSGLKQSELDLLTIPASSLVWDQFLACSSFAMGEAWTPNDDLLADVLTIDKVSTNDVKLEVTAVERGVATIRITGEATGLIDDAETEIRLEGTCEFDQNAGYSRQLQLTLQENRTICESAPGFDAVVKLDMRISRPSNDVLSEQEIQSLGLNKRQWTDSLVLRNATLDFGLRYDRRWRVIANEGTSVVLRYIDDNLLLGQCTLQALNSLTSSEAYSLDRFRQDVEKTTADKGRIVDDEEFTSGRGLRVMRIDVKGQADGVDVTWRYYHVAQDNGQRLSYVVTFDSEIASRFDGIDRRLIDSVEFTSGGKRGVAAQNASATRDAD